MSTMAAVKIGDSLQQGVAKTMGDTPTGRADGHAAIGSIRSER